MKSTTETRRGFLQQVGLGAVAVAVAPSCLLSASEPISIVSAPLVPMESLVPELWAKESLRILTDNMVMGNLATKDWKDKLGIENLTDRIEVK